MKRIFKSVIAMLGCVSSVTAFGSTGTDGMSAYLGVSLYPFHNRSTKAETKVGNTTTTVESKESSWMTFDPKIDLYARFQRLALRPRVDFGSRTDFLTDFRAGFIINDMFEVGGGLDVNRKYEEPTNNGTVTKTTTSRWAMGPYAVISIPVSALKIEVIPALNFFSVYSESTTGGTTTKSGDHSGFTFDVQGRAVYQFATYLAYEGGLNIAVSNETEESANGNSETKTGITTWSVIPLGLRFVL